MRCCRSGHMAWRCCELPLHRDRFGQPCTMRTTWVLNVDGRFAPILLRKSFCREVKNSKALRPRFRITSGGTSLPHTKFIGLAARLRLYKIDDAGAPQVLAKNSDDCNFRLFQQYPPQAAIRVRWRPCPLWSTQRTQVRRCAMSESAKWRHGLHFANVCTEGAYSLPLRAWRRETMILWALGGRAQDTQLGASLRVGLYPKRLTSAAYFCSLVGTAERRAGVMPPGPR